MNFKKIVSAVSALAISVSAFVGLATTANAATTTVDLKPQAGWCAGASSSKITAKSFTEELTAKEDLVFFNNVANYKCQGAALLQFNLPTIPEGEQVISAILTTQARTVNRTRTYDIYKLKAEPDKATYELTSIDDTKTTVDAVGFGTKLGSGSADQNSVNYTAVKTDVTDSVKTSVANGDTTYTVGYTNIAKEGYLNAYTTTLSVVYGKDPVNSITVNYQTSGGDLIKSETVDATGISVGDSIQVPFGAYVEKDGTYYSVTKNGENPWYGEKVTATVDTVVTKTVTALDGDYVAYVDLNGTTKDSSDIRGSYMGASRPSSVVLGNVEPGVYEITVNGYSRNNSSYVNLGDTELAQLNFYFDKNNKAAWGVTTTEVTVTTAGELKIVAKDGKTDYIDYVLVKKTAGLPSVSATPGNKAQGGTNYMTFDATPADVAAEDITDCGFAFINTATLTEAGSTIVWQKSTKRENGSFGTAIAQMADAEDSTIYAIPFIVGNSFAKLGEAVKSVFVK